MQAATIYRRRRGSVGEFDSLLGRPQGPEYYEEIVVFSRHRCYPEHVLEYEVRQPVRIPQEPHRISLRSNSYHVSHKCNEGTAAAIER
eukprot:SAG11_NODE_12448_length_703_cov_0.678808_2_plen_88_part_00